MGKVRPRRVGIVELFRMDRAGCAVGDLGRDVRTKNTSVGAF